MLSVVLFIFGISSLNIFISSQRHTLSEILCSPCYLKEPSVYLYRINLGSHFKYHLEISLLSCFSLTAFFDLISISIRIMQSLNSVDTPCQRTIILDESVSFTKGRRLLKLPSLAPTSFPSICSIFQPWESYLPMTGFFSWLQG